MKIYVCGGAVRDVLLNQDPKDLDYVVVGSSPEEMIAQGFQNVGASFPVFLHPETKEEYALARTERSIGNGYHDFVVDFNPTVTLEDDMFRRDLTINSLSVAVEDWESFKITKDRKYVIDYYNGLNDLDNKLLHHVSKFFADDPVRVLRVCRFAARYESFKIHSDTFNFMVEMVGKGMLSNLTTERVWLEFEKALKEKQFNLFIFEMNRCGALRVVCPSFDTLSFRFGGYISHSLSSLPVNFALWLRHFTPQTTKDICNHLKPPSEYSQAAFIINEFYDRLYNSASVDGVMNVNWTIEFLNSHNCFRDPSRIIPLLQCMQHDIDHILMVSTEKRIKEMEWLKGVVEIFSKINFNSIPLEERKDLSGKSIGLRINELRIKEIEILRNSLLKNDF